jgi:predicted DNA-binding transcriptional regulator YafY
MISVEHLEKIIALLLVHSQKGITVSELADACGVPLGILQQDLKAILNSSELQLPIYTDQDEAYGEGPRDSDSDESTGEEDLDSEAFLLKPHVRWYLLEREGVNPLIHLNTEEGLAILGALSLLKDSPEKDLLHEKILANFPLEKESSSRYIKGNMAPLHPIDPELFSLIESAVLQERRVVISYKGKEEEIFLEPLGLAYYSRLRCWYLVAQQAGIVKTFHLNKILYASIRKEKFTYPEGFSLKRWFAPRWGMEYGEPFEVKVRFFNRSQTISKLKKDVAHRDSRLTEEEDGAVLFEDRIIGKNEFIAWVLGFGSSAEVLEPLELREEILGRIQETLKRYI